MTADPEEALQHNKFHADYWGSARSTGRQFQDSERMPVHMMPENPAVFPPMSVDPRRYPPLIIGDLQVALKHVNHVIWATAHIQNTLHSLQGQVGMSIGHENGSDMALAT
jgi:hypothetical protein